ncbi:BLUF domain-containing protein [Cerasicoccus fimbriatus]|uniref:BLUF domain-containing protein n=1 Tax=Cerasicoccus fimbriatus TaxID=3014554 RepID=UPI0022B34F26|nr:BLUF domain-containing protein [Cerasicoccus sp. TK19100]
MFTRIAYISEATCAMDDQALKDLAEQSSQKNRKIEITGYLYFCRNRFFQYIEGPREASLQLMDVIRADARHTVKEELMIHGQPKRLFPGWNLRWLRQMELHALHLEHTISDFMGGKLAFRDIAYWEQRIWEMISQLAENQQQIPVKTGPIGSSNIRRILDSEL